MKCKCGCASKEHDWKCVRVVKSNRGDLKKYKIICNACKSTCGVIHNTPAGFNTEEAKAILDGKDE